MHFEILVEDKSGKVALDILVPKIIGKEHKFRVIAFKGIGHFPKNERDGVALLTHKLLNDLPHLLIAYGKTKQYQKKEAVVIVICDLDGKCLKNFHNDLIALLNSCNIHPETRFCIAVEEGEAWFLGDIAAIKHAYPNAKDAILKSYSNDSICGTWEKLADALYRGGSESLKIQGWQAVGKEKSIWAEKISPHMTIEDNKSPSFNYFVRKIREITSTEVNTEANIQ